MREVALRARPFTRRFQCLFGWDAEEACKQNDTKKLAKLLPGADAVEPAMLPAVAQMAKGSLPMIEDCRHWVWATEANPWILWCTTPHLA